jgi:transcriptional regulator with XRE-family HTH domain
MEDETEAFRAFLEDWLATTGWSQFELAMRTGIGQSIISRWLSPDHRRRTQPTDTTLRKLAPVVGRSFEDLMRMSGRWPDAPPARGETVLEPELASLLADLEEGWRAADTERRTYGANAIRALFHTPRKSNRRPRNNVSTHESGIDEELDKPKMDYSLHSVHA